MDASGVDTSTADALRSQVGALLAMCSNADLVEEWRERRYELRPEGEVPDWYGRIADVDEPAYVMASVLLAGEAKRQQKVVMAARVSSGDHTRPSSPTRILFTFAIGLVAVSVWSLCIGDSGDLSTIRTRVENEKLCHALGGIWNAANDPSCG